MQIENLSRPYKYGLYTRRFLLKFCRSYGSTFFHIRRRVVVFLSALMDENHQERFSNTVERKNRELSGNTSY